MARDHAAAALPPCGGRGGQHTTQERDAAASLLMLAGACPGGNKKSIPGSPSRAKESGSTSTSSPTARGPSMCGDHKCGAGARVFATGQALGCHKRRACAEVVVVASATPASSCSALALSKAPATMLLDLNLPPPGMPLPLESDQGGSLGATTLDLKLGFYS